MKGFDDQGLKKNRTAAGNRCGFVSENCGGVDEVKV